MNYICGGCSGSSSIYRPEVYSAHSARNTDCSAHYRVTRVLAAGAARILKPDYPDIESVLCTHASVASAAPLARVFAADISDYLLSTAGPLAAAPACSATRLT